MSMQYDRETGQVFTQVVAPARNARRDLDWAARHHPRPWFSHNSTHRARITGRRRIPTQHAAEPQLRGPRSLKEFALEASLHSIHLWTFESLQHLPLHVLFELWRRADLRALTSLNVWKALSKLLKDDENVTLALLRYHETLLSADSPLDVYTQPLSSASFDFLTCLSICEAFSIPELVKLHLVPNLAVLEIIGPDYRYPSSDQIFPMSESLSSVNDRVLRAWADFAAAGTGFKILRVLRLWFHLNVTIRSLQYLNSFPALGIFDVRGCSLNDSASSPASVLGWEMTRGQNMAYGLYQECAQKDEQYRQTPGVHTEDSPAIGSQKYYFGSYLALSSPVSYLPREESRKIRRYDRNPRICVPEAWDFDLLASLTMLGNLREDNDLKPLGITPDKVALVENEVVSTVPTACVRLGQMPAQYASKPAIVQRTMDAAMGNSHRQYSSDPNGFERLPSWDMEHSTTSSNELDEDIASFDVHSGTLRSPLPWSDEEYEDFNSQFGLDWGHRIVESVQQAAAQAEPTDQATSRTQNKLPNHPADLYFLRRSVGAASNSDPRSKEQRLNISHSRPDRESAASTSTRRNSRNVTSLPIRDRKRRKLAEDVASLF